MTLIDPRIPPADPIPIKKRAKNISNVDVANDVR